jgi:hypothetical protein
MSRELQPLREALSKELKADLFPAVAGVELDKLLQTYLDRLTMYRCRRGRSHLHHLALDASDEMLGSLSDCPNNSRGFQRFITWAEALRDQHGLRIVAIAGETSGIYY